MPSHHRSLVLFILHRACFFLLITVLLFTATRSESHDTSPAGLSMKEGVQAFERGAFGEALSHWKQAAEFYKGSGNAPAQVEALVFSSQALMALGQSKQALQALELALALAHKGGDPIAEASVLGHLGRTYLTLRQLPEALEYLHQTEAL